MSNYSEKMKLRYAQGTWMFIDPSPKFHHMEVEQVIIDATLTRHHYVEGYVRAVHGVAMEQVQHLDGREKAAIGVTASHRLGRFGTLHRLRLLPNGNTEEA